MVAVNRQKSRMGLNSSNTAALDLDSEAVNVTITTGFHVSKARGEYEELVQGEDHRSSGLSLEQQIDREEEFNMHRVQTLSLYRGKGSLLDAANRQQLDSQSAPGASAKPHTVSSVDSHVLLQNNNCCGFYKVLYCRNAVFTTS